jgi:hypothetical protein
MRFRAHDASEGPEILLNLSTHPFFPLGFRTASLPREAFQGCKLNQEWRSTKWWNRGLQMAQAPLWSVFLHFLITCGITAVFTACRWLTALIRKPENLGMPGQPNKAVPRAYSPGRWPPLKTLPGCRKVAKEIKTRQSKSLKFTIRRK